MRPRHAFIVMTLGFYVLLLDAARSMWSVFGNRKMLRPRSALFRLLCALCALSVAAAACETAATQTPKGAGPTGTAATLAPKEASPTETPAASPTAPASSVAPASCDFAFVMVFPVHMDRTGVGNGEEIRAEFRRIKELGVHIVQQAFSSGTTAEDWRAYFDLAHEEGIQVVPIFSHRENPANIARWNGTDFDLGQTGEMLETMKDHPALYAFQILDEPFHEKHQWDITTERMQLLYQQAKRIAPEVLISANFSREIARGEDQEISLPGFEEPDFLVNNPDYQFKDGMCDICQISALEFRNYGQGRIFYRDVLIKNNEVSRAAIRRENPGAQIWSSVQVFGSQSGQNYYMPGLEELQEMIDILLSPELGTIAELNGMVFQQWKPPLVRPGSPSGYSLSEREFEELRSIIKATTSQVMEGCEPN